MSNVIDIQGRKMNNAGFVQMSFEFVEAIAQARISQQESQVLWAIIRKTWGWNKDADVISGSQLSSMTGLTRQRCAEALVSLIEKGVVTRKGGSRSGLSIEQDPSRWTFKRKKSSDPKSGSLNTPKKTGSVTQIMGHSVTQKVGHTTDNTDIKDNTASQYGDLADNDTPANDAIATTAQASEPAPSDPPKARRTGKADSTPVQSIVDLYHEVLPELPEVRKLTDKRIKLIRARWNDEFLSRADGGTRKPCNSLAFWRDFLSYVAKSDFLMGRIPPTPGRSTPFTADLEWLLNESNFAKILEGKYHG